MVKKLLLVLFHDIYNKTNKKQKDKIEKEIGKQILGRFRLDINTLIKKSLEIKSLRAVKYDKYYEMLCEAIDSYILGHYKASIACCGIVSELISSELIKEINKPSLSLKSMEEFGQNTRLICLYIANIINQYSYQKLNFIRETRNSYIHSTNKKNEKNDSKKCINSLIDVIKIIYKPKK